MKKLIFILQAKGGVGKSFLASLLVTKFHTNKKVAFIDLDSSTRSFSGRFKGYPGLITRGDILDNNESVDRDKFISLIEGISESDYDEIYVDFGAPESVEFEKMLRLVYDPRELQMEFETIGIDLHFWVVMAGQGALETCLTFVDLLVNVNKGLFPITLWLNEGKINDITEKTILDKVVSSFAVANNLGVKCFGKTDQSESYQAVVDLMKTGEILNYQDKQYGIVVRIKVRNLINDLELV